MEAEYNPIPENEYAPYHTYSELQQEKRKHANNSKDDFSKARTLTISKENKLELKRLENADRKERTRQAFQIAKMIFSEPNLCRKTVQNILQGNERYYFITQNEVPIGCLGFELSTGKLCSAFIQPEYRRKGFMEKTFKAILQSNSIVKFATISGNEPMSELAKKLGFKAKEIENNTIVYKKGGDVE